MATFDLERDGVHGSLKFVDAPGQEPAAIELRSTGEVVLAGVAATPTDLTPALVAFVTACGLSYKTTTPTVISDALMQSSPDFTRSSDARVLGLQFFTSNTTAQPVLAVSDTGDVLFNGSVVGHDPDLIPALKQLVGSCRYSYRQPYTLEQGAFTLSLPVTPSTEDES